MRINSKEELQSKKAEIEQNIQSFTCRVLVCSGTGCMASGAQKIYDEMVRLCEGIDGVEIEMQKDIPHVGVIKTGSWFGSYVPISSIHLPSRLLRESATTIL